MDVSRYLCLMFAIGLLGSVRPITAVDCKNVIDMHTTQDRCFVHRGLQVAWPSIYTGETGGKIPDYMNTVLKLFPESICKTPDKFRDALVCLGNIVEMCKLSTIAPAVLIPRIVDKLCIDDKNVNLACAASKFSDVMQCETKKAYDIGSSSNSKISEYFCKKHKAQNDCQQSVYHSCGCATVRAYESIYLDIFYKTACLQNMSSISRVVCDGKDSSLFLNKPSFFKNTTSIFLNKPSFFFNTTSSFLNKPSTSRNKGLLGSVRPYVDCNSERDVHDAQGECFIKQGVELTRPYIYTPETGRTLAEYIDAVLKQIPESVCKKADSFRRALACLGDVIQQCGGSSISPTSTLPQIVDKLCINDKNLNLTCAAAKFNDAMQCEMEKAYYIGLTSRAITPEFFCKLYKAQNDCQRSLYHSCGCATVRAYETIYLDTYYQAVCAQSLSSISRVECDGKDSSIFLNKPSVFLNTTSIFPNKPSFFLNTTSSFLNKPSFFLNTTSIFLNKPSTSKNKGVGTSGAMSVLTLSLLLVAALFCHSSMF